MGGAPTPPLGPLSPLPGELRRSPAAARIGALAEASGLGLAHFEHRVYLPLPADWEPVGRPDLGVVEGWRSGVLPETKFRHFQLDRRIGSFHPGQQPKWGAHELCHGLVGFGWKAGASLLWLATTARLAELLPVALWYFFDEGGLRRCERHADCGALFDAHCPDCEDRALEGPSGADPGEAYAAGRAFVTRELQAIERGLRLGRPVSARYGSIDLSSDGLAYASAHGARLRSPAFGRAVELFYGPDRGRFTHIDDLSARVMELVDHITGESEAPPWRVSRWAWVAQDVGLRLLQVAAESEGEVADALDALAVGLSRAEDEAGIGAVIAGYGALHADYELPEPEALFAVGYPLPGAAEAEGEPVVWGRSVDQVRQGLESACPRSLARLGGEAAEVALAFAEQDAPDRLPIGRRFAGYLAARAREVPALAELADLARVEAALCHAPAPDPGELCLRDEPGRGLRLARGVERLEVTHDVEAGLKGKAPKPLRSPRHYVAAREAEGEVSLLRLSAAAGQALGALPDTGPWDGLAAAEREGLRASGVVIPAAWTA